LPLIFSVGEFNVWFEFLGHFLSERKNRSLNSDPLAACSMPPCPCGTWLLSEHQKTAYNLGDPGERKGGTKRTQKWWLANSTKMIFHRRTRGAGPEDDFFKCTTLSERPGEHLSLSPRRGGGRGTASTGILRQPNWEGQKSQYLSVRKESGKSNSGSVGWQGKRKEKKETLECQ